MAKRLVKRGSVVLVRYPFTDLTGSKVRPAVVLSPNSLLNKLDVSQKGGDDTGCL